MREFRSRMEDTPRVFLPIPRRVARPALSALLAAWLAAGGVVGQGQVASEPSSAAGRPVRVDEEPAAGAVIETKDESGQLVVGRVHAVAGRRVMVLLPDGRIVDRSAGSIAASSRSFRPISSKELVKRLQREFPRMTVRVSGDYVFVSNTSSLFTEVTRKILTTMLPGIRKYARKLDLEIHAPEFPLVVLMFRTRREFDAYERMKPEVLAYYSPWTNRIVLHEESPLSRVDPNLATRQTISTIAHEGAHQILHNIGVQQRLSRWPMWIAEGMAEYLAPTRLGRRMSWKGAGSVNDLRMLELEFYVKAKAFDADPGEMIGMTVQGAALTSTGYATAWALTHYLANRRKSEFRSLLADLSRLKPLESIGMPNEQGLVAEQLAFFKRHVATPLPDLESELIAYLEKLPYVDPFAGAPHVVALIRLRRGDESGWKANIFHTRNQAQHWCRQYLETLDADIQRQVELITVPNRPAAEQWIKRYAAESKERSRRPRRR